MESNWVDFKTIKRAVTIEQVLERYAVRLRRAGRELRGRCPIHRGDGADTFHANTQKNAFHCFSCQAKGNVLDFVAAMESCGVREAALKLSEWFSISASAQPLSEKPATSSVRANEKPVGESAGSDDQPNKPLGFQLTGIDHAHPYLAARGIEKETAEYFGVGFFSGKGSMSGRIVIPIENDMGKIVAYAGRSVDGTEPRYKLPAGFKKSQVLFNLCRAIEDSDGAESSSGAVVLVEGFFDCMKVTQAEYPCVALMGCSMSEQQEEQLTLNFRQVIIALDGDEAGRNAVGEIAARLAHKVWVRIVELTDGRQPDQLSTEEVRLLLRLK
jgi:DNA primase